MFWIFTTIITVVLICTAYLFWHFQKLPLLVKYISRRWLRMLAGAILAGGFFAAAFFPPNVLTALFLYVCMGYIVCDIAGLILNRTRFKTQWRRFPVNHFAWIFALLFCIYGHYNARNPIVREYDITIDKPLAPLRIAFISDTHIGSAVKSRELEKLRRTVNSLSPDLIVFGGDIYDEGSTGELKDISYSIWPQLNSRYGMYYITGNHEYASHGPGIDFEEIMTHLKPAKVHVMLDETLLIDDRFYLIGRKDMRKPRQPLAELMAGIDKSKPVILLDHQPVELDATRTAGVDLQLSGHTHNGQLFPFKWLLLAAYGVTTGHYQWGDFQLIVSSGYGTWRLPIRTSGRGELVLINLKGVKS